MSIQRFCAEIKCKKDLTGKEGMNLIMLELCDDCGLKQKNKMKGMVLHDDSARVHITKNFRKD